MMKAYDKHGEDTMKGTYVCSTPEEDAEYGEYIFKEVYGDPVPWPTQEEMVQLRRKLATDALQEEFDAEENQEEDEEAEEEEGGVESEADLPSLGGSSEPALPEDILTGDDVLESLQAEAQLGNGAASSGLNGAAASILPIVPLKAGDIVGDGTEEDGLECLDDATFTTLLLRATLDDWTEDDSLEVAAAKAKHTAETQAATKVFAKANPTISRGMGEMIKGIKHVHNKSLQRTQLHEAAAAPPPPPQNLPAVPKPPVESKGNCKGRVKGISKGKTPEEKDHYAHYNPALAGLGLNKRFVSDEAHAWMEEKLSAWQQENGMKPWAKPIPCKWYWDKRIECIEAGLVDNDHSWDVVRSWLTNVTKKIPHDAD